MLSVVQRYNFESESQPSNAGQNHLGSCYQLFKDTILKANHNEVEGCHWYCRVVISCSKIQFWKRITTNGFKEGQLVGLLSVVQRYNFESESQR